MPSPEGLTRWFGYRNGEETMFISPKRAYAIKQEPYPIPLKCAWLVREPEHMARICAEIITYFNLGLVEPKRAARIAFFIEDGIEDLIKMPPENRTQYVVGEGELFVDGKKLGSFEVTQEKNDQGELF